jgi:hypothetical protein
MYFLFDVLAFDNVHSTNVASTGALFTFSDADFRIMDRQPRQYKF